MNLPVPTVLLRKACNWCLTVPPYSRWWVSDQLFEALQNALEQNSRFFSEEPAYKYPEIRLRTVSIHPISKREMTRRPCRECGR